MMPTDPRAVGVLGGTFDPVHRGHVHLAEGVARETGLARVLFVPAATPPHKTGTAITSAEQRVAMLRLAVRGHERLAVDPIEIDRGGVSFTIETLRAIRDRAGGPLPVFLMGFDTLLELPSWREARALVREFDVVVVDRPGASDGSIRSRLPTDWQQRWIDAPRSANAAGGPLGRGGRIVRLPLSTIDAASSEVRRRVARGDRIDHLVPLAVARYIQRHRLYSPPS